MAEKTNHSGAEAVPSGAAARFALIEGQLDTPLSAEQAKQVRQQIARSIELGVALRGYPLVNADEPEIAMEPYRGDDR